MLMHTASDSQKAARLPSGPKTAPFILSVPLLGRVISIQLRAEGCWFYPAPTTSQSHVAETALWVALSAVGALRTSWRWRYNLPPSTSTAEYQQPRQSDLGLSGRSVGMSAPHQKPTSVASAVAM